jgi:hypothetical protein
MQWLLPFLRDTLARRTYFQPPCLFSKGHTQFPDGPKAEKTPCLHSSLLLALSKYFTRLYPADHDMMKFIGRV